MIYDHRRRPSSHHPKVGAAEANRRTARFNERAPKTEIRAYRLQLPRYRYDIVKADGDVYGTGFRCKRCVYSRVFCFYGGATFGQTLMHVELVGCPPFDRVFFLHGMLYPPQIVVLRKSPVIHNL